MSDGYAGGVGLGCGLTSAGQVEFGEDVTTDLFQRSDHRSVHALEADIRTWVADWNTNPKPFVWTKTAEQILARLGRLIQRTSSSGH